MKFNEGLYDILIAAAGNGIPIKEILVCYSFTILFSILIYFCYRLAVRNEFYSKDYNISLIIVTLISCSLVLTAKSNLITALGIAGALTIIKFRTAIKSPLDLTFMFWSASVGIICGSQYYKLAVVLSLIIIIVLAIFKYVDIPSNLGLLVIHTKTLEDSNKIIERLKSLTILLRLKNKTVHENSVELILEYKTKNNELLEKELVDIKEISDFSIINYDRDTRF